MKHTTYAFFFLISIAALAASVAQRDEKHMTLVIKPPPKGVQTMWPFYKPTKYLLIKEYTVHVLGTKTVSDWMMRESYSLIRNMIAALKRPEDRKKFSGHQAFLITDADPDLTQIGADKGHRNTGGSGFSLFNEALVCTQAVDTIRPSEAPEYRAWDTPIHEFGHAIELTLDLTSRSAVVFTNEISKEPVYADEAFAWTTETWFRSRKERESMPKKQFEFFSAVFSNEYDWFPTRDARP